MVGKKPDSAGFLLPAIFGNKRSGLVSDVKNPSRRFLVVHKCSAQCKLIATGLFGLIEQVVDLEIQIFAAFAVHGQACAHADGEVVCRR